MATKWSGAQLPQLAALCAELFSSLPRKDQRSKAVTYVKGLLGADGRKSIRNMAVHLGGAALEQGLQHFVSDSTWDWMPVRRALLRQAPPHQAWVLRPMVIPKAGENTVGVERQYLPSLGQPVNAQKAIGLWAASPSLALPVNWRMILSDTWLGDAERRTQAAIPAHFAPQSFEDCVVGTYLEIADAGCGPRRPVVLDASEWATVTVVRRLRAAGAPVLARIDPQLLLQDTGVAGGDPRAVAPAQRILGSPTVWRHVPWRSPVSGQEQLSLMAGARVRLPGQGSRREERELLLFGVGADPGSWPGEIWLTDLVDARPALLLSLAGLLDRVGADFDRITDRVGIRDFTGRSFTGWHRHVTLASAAHAIATRIDDGTLPGTGGGEVAAAG
ncbi:IS701 family transposase [Streptomyces sp. NPDC048441]|uniref:IS701 family transposase n=1 Tax=Streptomyces sp. NPDC048441 TaxID=3365552 RepID=UPI003712E32C